MWFLQISIVESPLCLFFFLKKKKQKQMAKKAPIK